MKNLFIFDIYREFNNFSRREIDFFKNTKHTFDHIYFQTTEDFPELTSYEDETIQTLEPIDSISAIEKLSINLTYTYPLIMKHQDIYKKGVRKRFFYMSYFVKDLLKNPDNTIYFYWGVGFAHSLLFTNKEDIRAKIVIRLNGYDLYEERNPLPYQKEILSKADLIVVQSQEAKDYLFSKYDFLVNKIEVIPMGSKTQEALPIKQIKTFKLLTIGNLTKLKRNHILLESLKLIDKDIEYICIGDGEERAHLEELSKELPSNIKVTFLGFLKHDEVINYLKDNYIDLFIHLSSSETGPVVSMEALSFGLPIISTNVGCSSDMIKENGYLLDIDFTPSKLKDKILEIYHKDQDEIKAMRDMSLKIFKEKFDSDKNYASLHKAMGRL